jgi:hypothetical protein
VSGAAPLPVIPAKPQRGAAPESIAALRSAMMNPGAAPLTRLVRDDGIAGGAIWSGGPAPE